MGFKRWAILIAVILAITAGFALWTQRDSEQAPAVAMRPAAPGQGDGREQESAVAQPPAALEQGQAVLSASVLFDYDQSRLRPEEAAKLDELAGQLKGRPASGTLAVVGHADRIGSIAYNQRLSERRAQTVKDYLAAKHLAVRTWAQGETQPVTGDQCANLGPEKSTNRKLIECLQPDRRADVGLDQS
jgi:OOP family OmpA-OmpF porin